MIVDLYTRTWEADEALGRISPSHDTLPDASKGKLHAGHARHLTATGPVDVTIVHGFKSHYLGAAFSNERLAAYVAGHPDRMLAFAGIDPSHPREAIAEMERARDELSMPGVTVSPAAQGFHPSDSQAMQVYAEAQRLRMPVLFDVGPAMCALTKLEYAQPVLLDEVARELPELRIIIAHLGRPWIHETLVLLAKHRHVYAEISGVFQPTCDPWQAHQTLLSAHQHGVMHKLLFGSGFPFAAASPCIETLYGLNHLVHGSNLPGIPREALRSIVERDALSLLGISGGRLAGSAARSAVTVPDDHDEEL